MAKFMRKWPCAVCGKSVIYDEETRTLTCGCYTSKCSFVDLSQFEKIEE